MRRRFWDFILMFCMTLTFLSVSVSANDASIDGVTAPTETRRQNDGPILDLSQGSITITEEDGAAVFKQGNIKTTVPSKCAVITQSVAESITNYVEVLSGDVLLTIQNLNISSTWSPIDMKSGAKLSLELVGKNVLTASGEPYSGNGHVAAAGIAVPFGAELTIYGDGTLTATGGEGGAGIGGGSYYCTDGNCGLIKIESGLVTAVGSSGGEAGAGIGGAGLISYAPGNGGTVIITGGTVTATGGANDDSAGAGIGGSGSSGGRHGGTVIITGGTVTATGGAGAAGIGGGLAGYGGRVTITDGTVNVIASSGGAAIGGGAAKEWSAGNGGGPVIITGGTVVATAKNSGKCIGGGYGGLVDADGCSRISIGPDADISYRPSAKIQGTLIDKFQSVVQYGANGGTGAMPDVTVDDGFFYTLPDNSFQSPLGMEFSAWKIGDEEYLPGSVCYIADDTVVTAIWKESPLTGYCGGEGDGTNLHWTLDSAGALTISGTGKMQAFVYSSDAPWYRYRHEIKTVQIQNGITSLAFATFYGCASLTSVTIPDSVISIGESAFSDCRALTSVVIPDSVTTIGRSAFLNCSALTGVTIPDSVETIGLNAFRECTSLRSATLGKNATSIGIYMFYHCVSLENVTIPDSVTAIGERAFCLCTSLKSVSVSTDVTSIGKAAFGDCFSLTDVYYAGTKEQWDTIVIDSNNEPLTDAHIHTQEARTLISIEIITPPNRLTYSVGDALDTTGLTVRANYSDDTSEELNVGFTLSGFDSSTAGSKAVTVTYQGKNAAFSVTVINPDAPRLTIENRTAFAGSSFTVPVLLTNNPGVIGFSFALEYDAEKLEYLGAADADFIGMADNISANDNQLGMVYFSASSENLTAEKVVNLTFRAKMGVTGAAKLSFVLDESFDDGFLAFNPETQENEPVAFAVEGGEISIADFVPGDLDANGKVDNNDLILLARYRARWKVSFNMDAADVDGNGKVNNEDLILLTRYRARWKVTLLPGKVSTG